MSAIAAVVALAVSAQAEPDAAIVSAQVLQFLTKSPWAAEVRAVDAETGEYLSSLTVAYEPRGMTEEQGEVIRLRTAVLRMRATDGRFVAVRRAGGSAVYIDRQPGATAAEMLAINVAPPLVLPPLDAAITGAFRADPVVGSGASNPLKPAEHRVTEDGTVIAFEGTSTATVTMTFRGDPPRLTRWEADHAAVAFEIDWLDAGAFVPWKLPAEPRRVASLRELFAYRGRFAEGEPFPEMKITAVADGRLTARPWQPARVFGAEPGAPAPSAVLLGVVPVADRGPEGALEIMERFGEFATAVRRRLAVAADPDEPASSGFVARAVLVIDDRPRSLEVAREVAARAPAPVRDPRLSGPEDRAPHLLWSPSVAVLRGDASPLAVVVDGRGVVRYVSPLDEAGVEDVSERVAK